LKFFKNHLGYLIFGIAIWLPILIVLIVLLYIIKSLEGFGDYFLKFFLPQEFIGRGLGLALVIIIFYLTGLILKKTSLGNFLSRIPLIGQFLGKGNKKTITVDRLLNLTPCLFLFSPTCPSYGWVLSEEKVQVNGENNSTLVNVYYPNVPILITGQIFPVRKETIIKLGNSSAEIINILLYAIKSPESIQYLPWDNENIESFKKRIERFGLNAE